MKYSSASVGSLVAALAVLFVAGSAIAPTTDLSPGEEVSVTLYLTDGDSISLSWSSMSGSVNCVIEDPDGDTIFDQTSTYYFDIIEVGETGNYVITWSNPGLSTVSVTYDASAIPFGDVDSFFDSIVLVLIIIAAIIVIIVVVVVVYLLMQGKKKKAAQMAQPPMQPAPAYAPAAAPQPVAAPGNCPMCGSPVDPQFMFCQKCGARVR